MAQLDLSQEHATWDETEALTLTSVRNSGNVAVPVATAKRQRITIKEQAASGGAYQADDLAFLLPTALLGGVAPKEADTVTPAENVVYTVLSVEGRRRDQSGFQLYRVVCRALAVVFDLRDTVSIQRATLTWDAAGGVVRHWPDGNIPGVDHGGSIPYQGISARVQLQERESADDHGVRGLRSRYTVIVDRQLMLTREDRVKVESWGGGSPALPIYLDIEAQRDAGRIDELPKLDCVRSL